MKILDSHTHVHSLPGHMWDSPPERILRLMDQGGIEKAIIMPYGEVLPEDPSLLDYTIKCVEKYPDRLIGFARMDPKGEEKGLDLFVKALESGHVKGLKFHPVGTRVHPAASSSVEYTKKAAEHNVPILFHCGDEEWTLPFQIAKLAAKVPEARIILGHMGGYFHVRDAIEVCVHHPNCYLETSATPDPRLIQQAIQTIGPQRVIFGSDGPGCLPALEVEKIKLLNLGAEIEEQLFYKNMAFLIGEEL